MPATMKQIRDGIATNLGSLTGVTVYTKRPATVEFGTPPFVWVRPPDGTEFLLYDQTFGNSWANWTMIVEAVHGDADPSTAEDNFNTTFWTTVPPAIRTDLTLGGVAQSLTVTGIQNYLVAPTPEGHTIVGAEWVVEVLA